MMSAAVSTKGAAFEAAVPVELFKVRVAKSTAAVVGGDRYYAVTLRGDRFIVKQFTSDVRASAITVVVSR